MTPSELLVYINHVCGPYSEHAKCLNKLIETKSERKVHMVDVSKMSVTEAVSYINSLKDEITESSTVDLQELYTEVERSFSHNRRLSEKHYTMLTDLLTGLIGE